MRISSFYTRGRRRRRGAALIEMVFSMMLLFSLVMGGVEFGWFLYAKHMIQSAARDGARAGSLSTTTAARTTDAIRKTLDSAGFQNVAITTTYHSINTSSGGGLVTTQVASPEGVQAGYGLRVQVTAQFGSFGVRPLGIIPASKPIVGVTTVVKE